MRIHFWHATLSLFYAALVLIGIAWLAATSRLASFIPLSDFVLMTLATFRLVHLFTYDSITAFIREWFVGYDNHTFKGSLGHLINCPWCTGLWFSFIVVFFYFATPFAWYIILILALAALGSSLQLIANWVGWSAEAKKKEAQGIALPR
ncbi:hypothetical protein A3H77_02390 [Candidatus Kaiserbacteria bacterium RIFCSPLOWO2_02_FULL_56_11]|uniref:DUF1360 domain-containing protein n=2 Tax=Candidatus Kaiseribacteriota TaxID=1752734 RepID=A0A1F6E4W1_9BACT|nr:MAG: hypothetical protein A3C95_01335 [Candidatus Kaiserbacteria bacterium RIFCSPHIGHO2_02_FULL_56_30]OGG72315.1 MAG: hypothetical protein A3E65_00535 [Candidatus Kaiserbacteria bacterium RIFCSPHIGHO2_12_FULL_56_13]OGG80875.1 MAG: hypothetical protein A3H77_02390 [Candidatus Kaiserbacteria bacterium RIFCSPLOWO2_02_FULL_56_11]